MGDSVNPSPWSDCRERIIEGTALHMVHAINRFHGGLSILFYTYSGAGAYSSTHSKTARGATVNADDVGWELSLPT